MIINDLDGYYIVFDTKNWNTELDTLLNNLLEGLISLGRLGGDNSLFNDYLKGDNASDLRKDWEAIGNDMRKVVRRNHRYRSCCGIRIE